MTDDASVSVRGLVFGYPRHQVFDGVDLDLRTGTNFVIGVNGAGKTTLFRLFLGDLKPQSGSIGIAGRSDIGYLPQAFGYPPHFTVEEFVSHLAWARKVPRRSRRRQVRTALAQVGLADNITTKMAALSGGMLRRAGVAQALVHEPKVVLLDEPTAGLDPRQRVELRALFGGLSGFTTLVISTHLLEDVSAIGGHAAVLDDGEVRFVGEVDELTAIGADLPGDGSAIDRAFLRLTDASERSPR